MTEKGPSFLSADEAARRMENDPATAAFTFDEFMKCTGLEWPQMLAELQAGRLIAGRNDAGGFAIRGDRLIEWLEARRLQ